MKHCRRLLSLALVLVMLIATIPAILIGFSVGADAQGEQTATPQTDAETTETDLFVFAGQSNMMGASVLAPETDTFTDQALEYKYVPKLRGAESGDFVSAQNPAGEWHYMDMDAAYGDQLQDLSYKSILSNYSSNTYFCPAMRNGEKGFSAQSEADTYASASLAPYFVTFVFYSVIMTKVLCH